MRLLAFSIILCTAVLYSHTEDTLPDDKETPQYAAKDTRHSNIIFTLEKFLFGVDSKAVTDRLGYISLARCIGWLKAAQLAIPGITGASQQEEFFNLLAKIQLPEFKKHQSIRYRDKEIPDILYHCWLGTTDNKTLLRIYRANIKQNTELYDVEKKTLYNGAALATTDYHTILTRIDDGIELVKQLKENTQHKLYLILNGNKEIVATLKKEHTDVFDLFDEVITSSEAQAINTQKEMYQYIMKEYNLNPENTVAVITFNSNKKAALQAGLQIINAKKQQFGYAEEQLKNMGLFKKSKS